MADLGTLLGHAVSGLISGGGTLTLTIRAFLAPIRRQIDEHAAQLSQLVARVTSLEAFVAHCPPQHDAKTSGSWVTGMQVEERLAMTEQRLAAAEARLTEECRNLRMETDRINNEVAQVREDQGDLVPTDSFQAYTLQTQNKIHALAEALAFMRGRFRSR